MSKLEAKIHLLDASGQTVGRLSTKIVSLLRGKQKAHFDPAVLDNDRVKVVNAAKLKFTGRKLVQKDYRHHTMFPGGLKRTPMKKVFDTDPAEVIRHAITGMLPKNKQRREILKRLLIEK
ncbi:MAG: 50S ribosomal protein L13 [Patescibacteria group bacterium]